MVAHASERISPTAFYTGFVWVRCGLAHPDLATYEGRLLHWLFRPVDRAYQRRGRTSLDVMLLARHRAIDHLLSRAIEDGHIHQVVEIAAGLSPRGYRFATRYSAQDLLYIEGDLPAMVARKRNLLRRARITARGHHLVVIDALADSGPASLAQVMAERLDPDRGTALITEGLLGYFPRSTVAAMWSRFARALAPYPAGRYLADLHTRDDSAGVRSDRVFRTALSWFARGRVYRHFSDGAKAATALRAAGFARAEAHDAAGLMTGCALRRSVVHIIEATTGAAQLAETTS
jgi:O-methyltransferase involved in polyketide biosynthesis